MEGIAFHGGEEDNMENKKRLTVFLTVIFSVLLCVFSALVIYISSPLHPKNITDKTVLQKGEKYILKLSGISEYDEKGFSIISDNFYFISGKAFVYKNEEGFACTSYEEQDEHNFIGKYNSSFVDYGKYSFCGESYKNREELEDFFEEPDRIYNFDINQLSSYIQDVMTYEKHFSGTATARLYRGRLVITEIYIRGEKVLEFKQ